MNSELIQYDGGLLGVRGQQNRCAAKAGGRLLIGKVIGAVADVMVNSWPEHLRSDIITRMTCRLFEFTKKTASL